MMLKAKFYVNSIIYPWLKMQAFFPMRKTFKYYLLITIPFTNVTNYP